MLRSLHCREDLTRSSSERDVIGLLWREDFKRSSFDIRRGHLGVFFFRKENVKMISFARRFFFWEKTLKFFHSKYYLKKSF